MALTLNGTKRWPNKKNLLRFGINSCLLSKSTALQACDEVIAAIDETMTLLSAEVSHNIKFSPTGTKMLEVWLNSLNLFKSS